MMIGIARVRLSPRRRRASSIPDKPGQHPVQQHQIGQGVLDQPQRLLGIVGPQRLVPGLLQVVGDELLDRRLVLHHQNGSSHPLSPAITAHPAIV